MRDEREKAPPALCAFVAVMLAGAGPAHATDVQATLAALAFPGDTLTRIEAGRFVEVSLPARFDRDLSVGIAFLVRGTSPGILARTVREEKRALLADPDVIAYGELEMEETPAELERLRLTPAQLEAFRRAAPGDELNLSLDEIAALRAVGDDENAVETAVRELLLARHRAYRSKGLAGIAPYARGESTTSPGDDLLVVNRGVRASGTFATRLYDALDHYPQGDDRPPDFYEEFDWVQFRAHGEDTIALQHVFQATFDGTPLLVQRQYYVTTGYNAEQAIVAFLPVEDGTLVLYTNHTSTDQLAGFGAGAKRAIGRTFMARQLEHIFENVRSGLRP